MALPRSDLAGRHPFVIAGGDRTADIFGGPPAIQDFGGLSEEVVKAAAERSRRWS